MSARFEWDTNKAASNASKHAVSFEDAATVFLDPLALIFDDEIHSNDEAREIIIGHSATNRRLLVWFTERNDRIRIIGARRATRRERREYEEHRKV